MRNPESREDSASSRYSEPTESRLIGMRLNESVEEPEAALANEERGEEIGIGERNLGKRASMASAEKNFWAMDFVYL